MESTREVQVDNSVSHSRTMARRSMQQILQTLGPLLALIVVVLGFTIADRMYGRGKFSEMRNIRVVLTVSAPVAVAACGMTLIIIAGGIDLSAGTSAMLCAT